MKNILIVEDELLQASGLIHYLKTYDADFNIYVATTLKEAQNIYDNQLIDLFLLDVNLSKTEAKISGIEIGLALREHHRYINTPIIYVTAVPEKIQAAVNDVHCFSYLYKPYGQPDIDKVLNDIVRSSPVSITSITYRNVDGIYTSVNLEDICYIHFKSHLIDIHTRQNVFSIRPKYFMDKKDLLPSNFVRIHKSYIINIQYISSYDKANRYIQISGDNLSLSRNYKQNFDSIYLRGV